MRDARQWMYPAGRPHASDVETLRGVAVLSFLDDSALEELAAESVCRCYAKGQQLDRADAEDGAMLAAICGGLCAGFLSGEGNLLPAIRLGSGEVFEFGQVVPPEIDDAVLQVTFPGTVVCCLPREAYERAVAAPPACRRWIEELRYERDELRALVSDRRCSVPERVRRTLWRHLPPGGQPSGPYTQAQLAEMCDTTQRGVGVVLGELAAAGIIEVDRRKHRLTIVDSEGLLLGGGTTVGSGEDGPAANMDSRCRWRKWAG